MTSKITEILRAFHAHVYYERETRASAIALREELLRSIPGLQVYPPIDRPVGPHPTPMFEIDFNGAQFYEVVSWLMLNHGEHSVLVHPITGDDLKDHFEYPIWIGKVQALDSAGLM